MRCETGFEKGTEKSTKGRWEEHRGKGITEYTGRQKNWSKILSGNFIVRKPTKSMRVARTKRKKENASRRYLLQGVKGAR